MRRLVTRLRFHLAPPPPPLSKPSPALLLFFTTTSLLSPDDLTQIHTHIHRLCDASHFDVAIRLLSTSLLAPSSHPISSLPAVPFLIDRLSSLPDLSASISLLTTLRHHNATTDSDRPNPIHFCCNLLISSYFRRRKLKEAAKVFGWMCRADSPCRPDGETYRTAVGGFCGMGRAIEAVKAVREMVRDGVEVGEETRGLVWRSLLREARVDEAKELDAALVGRSNGVGELLDRMIKDWEE